MGVSLDAKKCIICSYRKKERSELIQYPVPLCHWCSGTNLVNMLRAFRDEIIEECLSEPLIDCTNSDLFRFLSDLGELAASHPHLQVIREIISTLIMNIGGQNRLDYMTFVGKLPPKVRKRLVTSLFYLQEMGLVNLVTELNEEGFTIINEVELPADSIIRKALTTIESSGIWEERKEPNVILSYILIVGLADTVELIDEQDGLEIGQGITRLYAVNGRILVPKQFTAPLVFILGNWAREVDEFTQDNILAFLSLRGFNSRDRNRIMQFIAGVKVGLSHTIFRMERYPSGNGTHAYRFSLNPKYKQLRERIVVRYRATRQ
ncbi:MAG: hypothetical protein ACFFER_11790 [Candidatus Thorarchaeota archaeon]